LFEWIRKNVINKYICLRQGFEPINHWFTLENGSFDGCNLQPSCKELPLGGREEVKFGDHFGDP